MNWTLRADLVDVGFGLAITLKSVGEMTLSRKMCRNEHRERLSRLELKRVNKSDKIDAVMVGLWKLSDWLIEKVRVRATK